MKEKFKVVEKAKLKVEETLTKEIEEMASILKEHIESVSDFDRRFSHEGKTIIDLKEVVRFRIETVKSSLKEEDMIPAAKKARCQFFL